MCECVRAKKNSCYVLMRVLAQRSTITALVFRPISSPFRTLCADQIDNETSSFTGLSSKHPLF